MIQRRCCPWRKLPPVPFRAWGCCAASGYVRCLSQDPGLRGADGGRLRAWWFVAGAHTRKRGARAPGFAACWHQCPPCKEPSWLQQRGAAVGQEEPPLAGVPHRTMMLKCSFPHLKITHTPSTPGSCLIVPMRLCYQSFKKSPLLLLPHCTMWDCAECQRFLLPWGRKYPNGCLQALCHHCPSNGISFKSDLRCRCPREQNKTTFNPFTELFCQVGWLHLSLEWERAFAEREKFSCSSVQGGGLHMKDCFARCESHV